MNGCQYWVPRRPAKDDMERRHCDSSERLANGRCQCQKGGRLTVETPFVGDVVHEEDSHRAPVVRRRDRPEPLLSRRVPLCVTGGHCSQLSLRQTWGTSCQMGRARGRHAQSGA